MKNVVWSIITVCFILLINWGLVTVFNTEFIDFIFVAGMGVTVIIWFFNSSGGFSSNAVRMQAQGQSGIKVDKEKRSFNPTVAFYTSVAVTIIAAIITFIYYKDYFFN